MNYISISCHYNFLQKEQRYELFQKKDNKIRESIQKVKHLNNKVSEKERKGNGEEKIIK